MIAPRSAGGEPYSELEVVPTERNGFTQKESVAPGTEPHSQLEMVPILRGGTMFGFPEVVVADSGIEEPVNRLGAASLSRKRRRKWILWSFIVGVIVIVGAVLGGVLGTTLHKQPKPSPPQATDG